MTDLNRNNEKSDMADEISAMFALNKEFPDVFSKLAKLIKSGKLDKTILSEINAFVSFRMHELLEKKKSKKAQHLND